MDADYPLSQYLGFNLIPSQLFFLLSPLSHLYLINKILCCS
nr:MAG TPA: hypothetical protein [Bacteriophage sp.]